MIPDSFKSNDNLFSKFSKVDYSSPKKYLENAYGHPVIYYTKEDFIKKENKKKIYKISAFAATAVSIAAIAAFALRGKLHWSNFKANKMKNPEDVPILNRVTNAMVNANNIKDDYWDKFIKNKKLKKIPLFGYLEKIADKLTGFYKGMVKTALKSDYQKAYDKAIQLGANPGDLQSYESLFSLIDKLTKEKLSQKGNRVSDNLFGKSLFKRMTGGIIANEKILPEVYNVAPKTIIKEDWSPKLVKAVEEFNSQKEKTFNILTPKLRDINCGSAPTDFLTIILSTLGLSVAAISADSKEDRKSVCINLGIPLIATLLSTTIGNMKAFSGAKSLMVGLVSGQLASITAKSIDKLLKNKQNKDKTTQA